MTAEHGQYGTMPEDMSASRAWSDRFLARPALLPVSFVLDGRAVAGIPEEWGPLSARRRIDANVIETVFEGRDPRTGLHLRVECMECVTRPSPSSCRHPLSPYSLIASNFSILPARGLECPFSQLQMLFTEAPTTLTNSASTPPNVPRSKSLKPMSLRLSKCSWTKLA